MGYPFENEVNRSDADRKRFRSDKQTRARSQSAHGERGLVKEFRVSCKAAGRP
jgi:hypothetical protein